MRAWVRKKWPRCNRGPKLAVRSGVVIPPDGGQAHVSTNDAKLSASMDKRLLSTRRSHETRGAASGFGPNEEVCDAACGALTRAAGGWLSVDQQFTRPQRSATRRSFIPLPRDVKRNVMALPRAGAWVGRGPRTPP